MTQQAYLKASNTGAEDNFGWSVAVSEDTILVGAFGEASNATGVNGSQNNNNAPLSGAAYVFFRQGTNWTQQAYLKASNTAAGDEFGFSVAVSGDTAVVGAVFEASNATGVNGSQANNSALDAGAAYVFTSPSLSPPELRLAVTRSGDLLEISADGTPGSSWRLESRDMLTGPNAWQPVTNITLGTIPTVIQESITAPRRFHRGVWLP